MKVLSLVAALLSSSHPHLELVLQGSLAMGRSQVDPEHYQVEKTEKN